MQYVKKCQLGLGSVSLDMFDKDRHTTATIFHTDGIAIRGYVYNSETSVTIIDESIIKFEANLDNVLDVSKQYRLEFILSNAFIRPKDRVILIAHNVDISLEDGFILAHCNLYDDLYMTVHNIPEMYLKGYDTKEADYEQPISSF